MIVQDAAHHEPCHAVILFVLNAWESVLPLCLFPTADANLGAMDNVRDFVLVMRALAAILCGQLVTPQPASGVCR